jgi:hypothetical protein
MCAPPSLAWLALTVATLALVPGATLAAQSKLLVHGEYLPPQLLAVAAARVVREANLPNGASGPHNYNFSTAADGNHSTSDPVTALGAGDAFVFDGPSSRSSPFAGPTIQVPLLAVGVALSYNLVEAASSRPLVISVNVFAGLHNRQGPPACWDDPAIRTLNPDAVLPHEPIMFYRLPVSPMRACSVAG